MGEQKQMIEVENKLSRQEVLIEDSIKKCQTHAHLSKSTAGDLRNNGFDGELAAILIRECELTLKYAHLYQAYINCDIPDNQN